MLRFLVIQKQPPCYNALKLLTCSTVFINAVALQSEAQERFSALFYTLMLQNAEVQASPPSPARGAALRARLGSAVCLEVHRCCSLPVCSSSSVFLESFCVLVFWVFFYILERGLIWTSCSSVHLPWEGWEGSGKSLVWAWSSTRPLFCLVRNSSAKPRAVIPW